ncbi:MAG: hypothetical protein LBN32_00245, partial [Helicobacteraceae bacterium]|nr:hypothetical protein [Helicobacteraceae bacterium]
SNERNIKRVEAKKDAFFDVNASDSNFEGGADEFSYALSEGVYRLKGRAWVEDITNKRRIEGENIILNVKTRVAQVIGEEATPVKFIFTIQDRNESRR